MSATRRIAVVTAGLSQPSSTRLLADRLAEATTRELQARGVAARVSIVELRDHAQEITNAMLTGFPPASLREVLDTVTGADGLIAVTPIFSTSYSGLFKSFFDVVDDGALAGMPVVIAATAGTARHSLALDYALRPLFTYLHTVVVPTGVFAAADDWGAVAGREAEAAAAGAPVLATRIDRAAAELATLVAAAAPRAGEDPFADPTPFTELLAGS